MPYRQNKNFVGRGFGVIFAFHHAPLAGERMSNRCGLDVSIPYISGKWKPMLLYHLQSGRRRFGELRRLVFGISEKVLLQQLNELVEDELVRKLIHEQSIPKVEYEVTEFGLTLIDALRPLCDWGNANRDRDTEVVNG